MNIPDSFMTINGQKYRVYWDEVTGQFESELVSPPSPIRVVSYGGGVQSTALLVLAAQGKIDYKTFLFCNVGADSENPDTLTYVEQIAKPYALANDLELLELQRTWQKGDRSGQPISIYGNILSDSRSVGIPVRMSNGAPGNRSCTVDFKVNVVDRWLREHGAKEQGATVGLGISMDEWHRMRNDSGQPWKRLEYPLIDLRLTRQDCMNVILAAGLPVPPKSSCYFCPFHSMSVWQEMRTKQPELFQKACDLEEFINKRRDDLGKDHVWLSGKLKPLAMATTSYIQDGLFEDEEQAVCESGYCMI